MAEYYFIENYTLRKEPIMSRIVKIRGKSKVKMAKTLEVVQPSDRILTSEEISLLSNKLHGKDLLMILFGLFCGLRLNETLKLRRDDIDSTTDKGILSHLNI